MSSKAEIEQSVTALFNEKRNLIIVSDVSETLLLPEGQVNTDLYAFLIKAAMDEHKVFIASQGPLQILLDIHRQLLSKQLKDTFSQEAINGFSKAAPSIIKIVSVLPCGGMIRKSLSWTLLLMTRNLIMWSFVKDLIQKIKVYRHFLQILRKGNVCLL